jgi:hypothetical protein
VRQQIRGAHHVAAGDAGQAEIRDQAGEVRAQAQPERGAPVLQQPAVLRGVQGVAGEEHREARDPHRAAHLTEGLPQPVGGRHRDQHGDHRHRDDGANDPAEHGRGS